MADYCQSNTPHAACPLCGSSTPLSRATPQVAAFTIVHGRGHLMVICHGHCRRHHQEPLGWNTKNSGSRIVRWITRLPRLSPGCKAAYSGKLGSHVLYRWHASANPYWPRYPSYPGLPTSSPFQRPYTQPVTRG